MDATVGRHDTGGERAIAATRPFPASPTVQHVAEIAYLVLAPVLAARALGISLIDQQNFVDPEFYTGYGQSFERMWSVFGLTYYAARFPIMFLNTASQWLLPGIGGYLLVRALVFAASALPLYALARRRFGTIPAAVAYAFLFLNPLFPRVLCWDLTTFLSIPMGLSGICLWLLSRRPVSLATFAAGFAFAVSINSHIFTGTAIAVFLSVEFVFAIRRPAGFASFTAMVGIAILGALTCLGLGLCFYTATVGFVSPEALWQVTWSAIVAGQQYADSHYVALSEYYATNYEIYVPLAAAAALLAVNGRDLLRDTIEARITWFVLAYLTAYCAAVFLLHMNIVQFFWYFGHLTIAVYLAVPVIVSRLALRAGWHGPGWFVITLAGVAMTVAVQFPSVVSLADLASGKTLPPLATLAAGTLAAGLLALRTRAASIAGGMLLAVVVQTPFLSWTHLSVYDRSGNRMEQPLFEVIRAYHAILNRYDGKGHRVRSWYPTPDDTLGSIGSSNLLYTLQDPWAGPGLPTLPETALKNLREPTTSYVLLFSRDPTDVEGGLRELSSAGIKYKPVERQQWGRAPIVITAVLISLQR